MSGERCFVRKDYHFTARQQAVLAEGDTDPLLFPPDHVAYSAKFCTVNHKREIIRNTDRAGNLKTRAVGRQIPHKAINAASSIENDRAGLQNSSSGHLSSFVHGTKGSGLSAGAP